MRISWSGVLGGLLALTIAVVCVRLGFWQLERLDQRQAFNVSAAGGLELPPIVLDSAALARIRLDPAAFVQRRAVALGRYSPGAEIVLRGRSHAGRPGVHLASVLYLMEEEDALIVNRGWVPSPDAATVEPRAFTESGVQRIEGVLQLVPHAGAEAAPVSVELEDTSIGTFRRLDYTTLAAMIERPLLPLYLQAVPGDDDGFPIPVPLPTFDEGPHLGYAIQWFSFAAIAILGFTTLVWLRMRSGRSGREDRFGPPPRT